MSNDLLRIEYALDHVMGKSVTILSRDAWESLVCHTGEPTDIVYAPVQMTGILRAASVVAVAGSGIFNPSPGIDVVRHDPRDRPYVYNIDHYTVIENLLYHPEFDRLVTVARVDDNEELQIVLNQNVFIVGPYRMDNHWSEDIPEAIRNAKPKSE